MRLKDKIVLVMLFILLVAFAIVYTLYKNTRVVKANSTTTTTTTEVITTTSTTSTTTTTTTKKKKTTKKVVHTKKYHITGWTEESIKNYLHEMVLAYGWTEEDYVKALYIMTHESMNPNSRINRYDYVPCGLAQAKPCSKVPKQYRQDWKYQVRWFLDYIKNRYKTVDNAYKYKRKHGNY